MFALGWYMQVLSLLVIDCMCRIREDICGFEVLWCGYCVGVACLQSGVGGCVS